MGTLFRRVTLKKELEKEHGIPAAGYEEITVPEWNTNMTERKERKDYV